MSSTRNIEFGNVNDKIMEEVRKSKAKIKCYMRYNRIQEKKKKKKETLKMRQNTRIF